MPGSPRHVRWFCAWVVLSIIVLTALILTTSVRVDSRWDGTSGSPPSWPPGRQIHWPGWAGIKHMIVFGDSYTTTGFDINKAQPSELNPLGNPGYPGTTSCNGPNWVDFLTTTYNKTFLKTVNFASGGATVDSVLVKPFRPFIRSLKDQISGEYLPHYSSHPPSFEWTANDTLFACFFGINDVKNAYSDSTASRVLKDDIAKYADLMDVLYQSGARNFLFLNVPPIDCAPSTVAEGAIAEDEIKGFVAAYNANISRMSANLSRTYTDATTFLFDTHGIFSQVLDKPCSYSETCAYQDTKNFCDRYKEGTPSWYSFDQNCPLPVDQYFWLNPLHPTFRIMNATARAIAGQLDRMR